MSKLRISGLTIIAAAVVIAGIIGMSAFEAHVINVTARIENALSVTPDEIMFGTVFPQEILNKELNIGMSGSFITENRAESINYAIKQKPKPRHGVLEFPGGLPGHEYCLNNAPADAGDPSDPYYEYCYPNLCGQLSKHKSADDQDGNDAEVDVPHDPFTGTASGRLAKGEEDLEDNWLIDLVVPCFAGQCDQAYDPAVYGQPLDPRLEHETFGCDLWVEVSGVNSDANPVGSDSLIAWNPQELEITAFPGTMQVAVVNFMSNQNIDNFGFVLAPEISQFAEIEDGGITNIVAGEENGLYLMFDFPSDTMVGAHEGILFIDKDSQAIAKSLPIKINIIEPDTMNIPSAPTFPSLDKIIYIPETNSYEIKNELIITFYEWVNMNRINEIIDSIGGAYIFGAPEISTYEISLDADNINEVISELEALPEVKFVFQSWLNTYRSSAWGDNGLVPNDEEWEDWGQYPDGNNWAHEFIELPSAWGITTGSDNVIIAVIDKNFDINHEDISPNLKYYPYDIETLLPIGGYQHGTEVAGIIGAKGDNMIGISGVMWDVDLLLYPTLLNTSSWLYLGTYTSGFSKPLTDVMQMLDAISRNAKIINYSSGSNHGTIEKAEKINQWWKSIIIDDFTNVLFVFSAGQTDADDNLSSPSYTQFTSDNVISVAQSNRFQANNQGEPYSFSDGTDLSPDANYGEITVAAPGDSFLSTYPDSDYGNVSGGSSFSAPLVSGVAGLLLSVNPLLSASEIKSYIVQGAANGGKQINSSLYGLQNFYVLNAKESLCLALDYNHPVCQDSQAETGILKGIVKNALTDETMAGVHLEFFREDLSLGETTSQPDGSYSISLSPGQVGIEASIDNFLVTVQYGEVITDEETILDITVIVPATTEETGSVMGIISDAVTGFFIGEALVELREGINNTSGDIVYSGHTHSFSGVYEFSDIAAGVYTAAISKAGYLPNTFILAVIGGESTSYNGNLTPVLGTDEIRIILTWGAAPFDLDSHLTGPIQSSADRFHVYYSHRGSLASSPYAYLDRDDTSAYGPETVTITQSYSGTYRYSVHDYTNKSSASSMAMSNSGAQIRVFADFLADPLVYNVPPNTPGTVWTVFEMDGDTHDITPINTFSFESYSGNISSF